MRTGRPRRIPAGLLPNLYNLKVLRDYSNARLVSWLKNYDGTVVNRSTMHRAMKRYEADLKRAEIVARLKRKHNV